MESQRDIYITMISSVLGPVARKLETLDGHIEGLTNNVGTYDIKVNALGHQVASLIAGVRDLHEAVKQSETKTGNLETRMLELGAQNGALLEVIRQNETRIANLETKIATLETQNNTLLEAVTKSATEQVKATQSWAQVLKTGLPTSPPTSQGTPITQICSIHPSSSASQQDTASSPHVVIDFSTAERCSTIITEKPGAIRRRIDDALEDHDVTKEIKCQGISRNARDSNKYKVFFKNEKAVQTVRQNDAWLKGYLRGARLQAEQWHPIRVDSVYKGAVLKNMGGHEVKEEATQMVAEENEVQVHKIQWLSKPDSSKIHGSMVLYLARRQDAEKLLRDGRVEVDGETAFARPYERRTGPMRCFKCHQFNHMAARCPSSQPVCSRCAGTGHTHRECTSDRVKCATCGGLHSTFDPSCRLYKA
ncbi:MAG TPA: hypothetical protein VIT23_15540, partial [Terrimicrobiaceae bacterium]